MYHGFTFTLVSKYLIVILLIGLAIPFGGDYMTTYRDDHPEKWTYQSHTRAKHDILAYYLDTWTRIVSDSRFKIRIFDCFAGRGDYEDSDGASPVPLEYINSSADYPGSPLIILDQLAQHTSLYKEAECYFIEPNDNNREDLESKLEGVSELPKDIQYEVVHEEFQNVDDFISGKVGWDGFAFFFIDPFGLKDLDFQTVTRVASTSRFDCLITLMTKELIRWQESDGHQEAFETLYGTSEWKEQLQQFEPDKLQTAEAEFYCNRLENHGIGFTLAYMTTRSDSIELVYDLIFTTNNLRGVDAMKESMARCGSDYALAYAPERADIGGMEQTKLVGGQLMTEEKTAKSYLVTRFAGEELTFDEVVKRTLEDPDRRYARSLRKDYRKYLIDLDNKEEIEIPDRVNEDDPLPPEYTIHFPDLADS